MEFFNSHLFWFLEGILFCLLLAGFKVWAEDRHIPMPFWKWLLVIGWVVFAGFTVAFIGTSLGEREATAAAKGGILFGILTVVAGVVIWRLLMIGRRTGDNDTPADA